MKRIDFRLKLLAGLLLLGFFAIMGALLWWFYSTNASLRFGNSDNWPSHTTELNNITFKYPLSMEIIVPTNEKENPVSVVKKGERGESVLIQVGTWRLEDNPPKSLDEIIARYEGRFPTTRPVISKEHISVGGRDGVVYFQTEAGGRFIGEAFFWDVDEPREISLQLPESTQGVARELWKNTYLEIIHSLEFLTPLSRPGLDSRPEGVPAVWRYFENKEAGFSLWYPPNWIAEEYQKPKEPAWLSVRSDAQSFVFHPLRDADTVYIVHVFPEDEPTRLAALDSFIGQLFRRSAAEGSLGEEQVGLPYVGAARSFEGVQTYGDKNILTYLLLLIATPTFDENGFPVNYEEPGRGYVIANLLPEGKAQEVNTEDVRVITTSFRLMK